MGYLSSDQKIRSSLFAHNPSDFKRLSPGLQATFKMSTFAAAAIAQADLVKGTLYAVLLISKNLWTYGVYNGDHVYVTAAVKMPLFTMRNLFTGADQLMVRTGPGTFDHGEVLFYPTTHNVEEMVHAEREKWRVQDAKDGGGWLRIVRLRCIGWTLEEWAATAAAEDDDVEKRLRSYDAWFDLLLHDLRYNCAW